MLLTALMISFSPGKIRCPGITTATLCTSCHCSALVPFGYSTFVSLLPFRCNSCHTSVAALPGRQATLALQKHASPIQVRFSSSGCSLQHGRAVQHSCIVNDDEGTLTVTLRGDSSVTFALELASRSKTLHMLLPDSRGEAQFAFSVPQGLLRAWLTCARVLTAQADTLTSLDVQGLVKCMKVRLVH